MNTVLIFGTFDNLHAGHLNLIEQAREYGEINVVIALDKTVKQIKGYFPEQNEKERLKSIKKNPYIKYAELGNDKDKYTAIKKIKPSIIALGYDQYTFTHNLQKIIIQNRLNCKIIRLKPYKSNIYKSSILKQK